jgi:hypothetical protein
MKKFNCIQLRAVLIAACLSVCVSTFVRAQLPSYVPSNGLVAWYPFNGNANDESGNGKDGIIIGNVSLVSDRNGKSDKSYYFDGLTGCIVTDNSQLTIAEGNFTLSLWLRPEDVENMVEEATYGTSYSHKYAIGGFWGNTGSGISLAAGTNGISVLEHGHQFLPVVLSYPSTIGTNWVHVTLTCSDNGAPILYLNGKFVRLGLDTGRIKYLSVFNQSGPTGNEGIGGGNYGRFKGKLDDIRVYPRALSAEEVAFLHAAESPAKSFFQIIEGSFTWREAKADADGIVCLSSVRGEQTAADRLLALLADAYGADWTADVRDKLLADVGAAGKTLDDWLRAIVGVPRLVRGERQNFKVTTADDLALMGAWLGRVGPA